VRITLHAGLKKTGTTAIQVALARNAQALCRQGAFVPETEFSPAGTAMRTSGNAYAYALAAAEAGIAPAGAATRVARLAAAHAAAAEAAGCDRLLLSSEALCALPRAGWQALAEGFAAAACSVRCIVFERDPYAWFFSVWLQALKRDGCPHWLDAALAGNEEGYLRPLLTRPVLEKLGGNAFETLFLDYDACRGDAAGAFAAALGLALPEEGQPARYNRSLTAGEVFAFLACNRASGGDMKLCQELCDKYVHGDADREPFFFFDPAVQARIHAFLAAHGADRPKAAYAGAPNLTEAALAAGVAPLVRLVAGMLGDAVAHFRDFSGSVAALALHKARHFAASPARALVPDDFDVLCYLIANPDVLAADCDPYRHFVECGQREGRTYRRF